LPAAAVVERAVARGELDRPIDPGLFGEIAGAMVIWGNSDGLRGVAHAVASDCDD
jgi:hypothetical protein